MDAQVEEHQSQMDRIVLTELKNYDHGGSDTLRNILLVAQANL